MTIKIKFDYVFFSMHFRKCVALVVRDYAARRCNLPDPLTLDEKDFIKFLKELNGQYAEMAAVIYLALCGVEFSTPKARLTVTEWLRWPQTLAKVRR